MNYTEAVEWLYAQVPMFQNLGAGAYKPGLGATLALAAEAGNPQNDFPAIHIAGTNGKGSTAHTLAAILQNAGYKTGLYTSPHLVDFRERIRVNGRKIDPEFVAGWIRRIRRLHPDAGVAFSFFELTTIMAFCYFAWQKVDVAVIETGLGGRLDSTNIIAPVLSVITNISKDHTSLLGNTPAEIATEKAGIIKPGVPVVIGRAEGDVARVFRDTAAAKNAPVVFAGDVRPGFKGTFSGGMMHYSDARWGALAGALTGACQAENAATVLAAVDILEKMFPAIDDAAVAAGFADVCSLTGLMGRWMWLPDAPVPTVCDTGHNEGGWQWLGPQLAELASKRRLRIVAGFVNDKDVASIVRLMPADATYYFATPSVKRGMAAEITAAEAARAGRHGRHFDTVEVAYSAAVADSDPASDTIFVGGSTFIVADLLALRPGA